MKVSKKTLLRKYRIEDMLAGLPSEKERRQALRDLRNLLDLSDSQLYKKRFISFDDDSSDWTGRQLEIVADYFKCKIDDLYTKIEPEATAA